MSLLRAELRRLTKRRVLRWMLLLVVLLMAVVAVSVAAGNQKPGPAALAEAEAHADRETARQQEWIERDIAECERAKQSGSAEAEGWPDDCGELRGWYPDRAQLVEMYMPPAFEFRSQFGEMITLLTGLLAMFGFVIGASFVGAEWRSGGMMNLLLWRPRRLRVLGAKLLALLGTLTGLWLLLGAAWTGGFWLVAVLRGITDTMTSGTWQSYGLAGLRGLTMVLVAAAIGFALASIGRHTAMALGSAIAAFVVGVAGMGLVAAVLQLSYPEAWIWPTYVYAWMQSSIVLTDYTVPCQPTASGACVSPSIEITWQVAGLGIAAVVGLLLLAAAWQMRRRDVT